MTSRTEKSRPDLYVISRIIKCIMDEGPLKKTNLSVSAGLSYDNLVEYLGWMSDKGLIRENDGFVHLTDSGISTFNELVNWIINYVGKLKFGRSR